MLPTPQILETLLSRAGERGFLLHATRIAEALFGNTIAANILIVGYAWQKGLLPISAEAFAAAIESNGAAVALNKRAFAWGRLAAVDPDAVDALAGLVEAAPPGQEDVAALVARRVADLTAYQDAAYADRYAALMRRVVAAAAPHGARGEALVRAVAANAYRLMAYKDEYEVARLYGEPAFRQALAAQFSGTKRLSLYLAPPFLSRIDPRTGRPAKRRFGPWIFGAMALLAKGRRLRGGWADPFGRTTERRAERALRDDYLAMIDALMARVDAEHIDAITAIAALPDQVRGYGPVKEQAMAQYRADLQASLARLENTATMAAAA
ncbi:MAG: hypothetical protein CVT83_01170 [Alphaproteobacteria bacterium HGW-Alphaproteobacteria-5]|nr:MAG: hypothetical protein CVT83_01170 [Alphaproteobacteria bacterium HGW-Alphaproteobacteria-5]